ncbi:unannotated protein [freshwater metagenome]|uniref:Unannotated protein n=1 Tax=freshwater metagenome TaxID=449393 RepID=A0A6J6YMN0_9ZZZZ
MIERRRTNKPIPAGKVSNATMRMPSDVRSMNAALSPRVTKRESSGTKVVAIDTASKPWGSTKKVKAAVYAACWPSPEPRARFFTTTMETWLAIA